MAERRVLGDLTTNSAVTFKSTSKAIAVKCSKPNTNLRKSLITSYLARHEPDTTHFESRIGFLDLPREIRDKIYDCMVPVVGNCCADCRLNGAPVLVASISQHIHQRSLDNYEPPFSRTCRKVRAELLHIFYAKSTFHFLVTDWHIICVLQAWRKILPGEHALAIRRLTFSLSTVSGFRNSMTFLRIMQESFANECKYHFYGDSPHLCSAFQTSCAMGQKLRDLGADWEEVQEHIDSMIDIVSCTGFLGEWPPPCPMGDEDYEEDEDNDGDDGDSDLPDLMPEVEAMD